MQNTGGERIIAALVIIFLPIKIKGLLIRLLSLQHLEYMILNNCLENDDIKSLTHLPELVFEQFQSFLE